MALQEFISGKGRICFFLFLIIFSNQAYAQFFGNHVVMLRFGTGLIYGISCEILYKNSYSSDYSSELQWNMKPLFFAGIVAEYGPQNPLDKFSLYFSIDTKFGMPAITGVVEDRDWDSPSLVPGSLTHFSSHDNKTTSALLINFAAGLSVPLKSRFLLKFSLNLSFMYFKFECWNGYTQYDPNDNWPYEPWNPEWPKTEFSGLGIDYLQFWGIIKPTLGLEWHGDRFTVELAFSISTFAFCYAQDNHFVRYPPLFSKSYLENGFFIEPKCSIDFLFNKNLGIGLSLSYTYIDNFRGNLTLDERWEAGTVTRTYSDYSGANLRLFSGEINFKIIF